MECRPGCGACCIAISISTPLPGMPEGKPAGMRCIHLNEHNLCNLFGKPERPAICEQFQATEEFCGNSYDEAIIRIAEIENLTRR